MGMGNDPGIYLTPLFLNDINKLLALPCAPTVYHNKTAVRTFDRVAHTLIAFRILILRHGILGRQIIFIYPIVFRLSDQPDIIGIDVTSQLLPASEHQITEPFFSHALYNCFYRNLAHIHRQKRCNGIPFLFVIITKFLPDIPKLYIGIIHADIFCKRLCHKCPRRLHTLSVRHYFGICGKSFKITHDDIADFNCILTDFFHVFCLFVLRCRKNAVSAQQKQDQTRQDQLFGMLHKHRSGQCHHDRRKQQPEKSFIDIHISCFIYDIQRQRIQHKNTGNTKIPDIHLHHAAFFFINAPE